MVKGRLRLIVGVDYGTTYSGVSYVVSNETDIDQIEVIDQWPGTVDTVCKVPTRIAYSNENPGWDADRWGFSAGSESYTWTKLLLDGNTELTEYDDPALKDLFGTGMMRLPSNKTAKQVCVDYLTYLYQYMVHTLCKRYSEEVYASTPIDLWITVPAIWSDAAKEATKSAAISAGFGDRKHDRINVISEPEAAALTALKPCLQPDKEALDPLHVDDVVMVCDCGGGTVDITTYQILSIQPLEFEELCVGIGGKCGSTFIDRNFNNWMTKTFGKSYTSLPPKRRGPGSPFMHSFELAKRNFRSSRRDDQKFIEIDCIQMKAAASSFYDPEESTVKLTWDQMKSFFDPVIKEIIRLIDAQVDVAKSNDSQVNRIVLVGGFGDSDYLNERLTLWKSQQSVDIKLTCPPQPQAAVVRGAALRGLEGIRPISRRARRHYGHGRGEFFRPGIDPESLSYICPFTEDKMCRGRLSNRVSKGQMIKSEEEVSFSMSFAREKKEEDNPECKMRLYSCSKDDPPEYYLDSAVEEIGEVLIRFTKRDFEEAQWRYNHNIKSWVFCLTLQIKMNMDPEAGTLSFRTFTSGRPAGETTINYRELEAKAPKRRHWGNFLQYMKLKQPTE